MVHARDYYRQLDHQQPTRDTLTSMRALELAPHDLVLTNAYSEGYVGAVPGGKGVLDGRAPYSEPKTLKRANRLLEQSISFFADPVNQPLPPDAQGHRLRARSRPTRPCSAPPWCSRRATAR